MAAFAPRPSAIVSTAKNVNPGLRFRTLHAYWRSWAVFSMATFTAPPDGRTDSGVDGTIDERIRAQVTGRAAARVARFRRLAALRREFSMPQELVPERQADPAATALPSAATQTTPQGIVINVESAAQPESPAANPPL